jgi:hypothetical protein
MDAGQSDLDDVERLVASAVQAIAFPRGGFTWLIGSLDHYVMKQSSACKD